jgi:hypothetical protein
MPWPYPSWQFCVNYIVLLDIENNIPSFLIIRDHSISGHEYRAALLLLNKKSQLQS